ncbi:BgTH12-04859 [Blumeria graminis f. sp. triticale]|uniref:BgTH12-04859 n=1 Tax=Blumeria graminis f. sp. triticale TaxID=1689686 RepID=A0A9W4GB84_BLUGR|nr:BgTH12-04859 [Blumeria graminis f. sp. triticale]
MASPASRHSIDSLSPTSPGTIRSEYTSRAGTNTRFQPRNSLGIGKLNSIGGTLDTATHWQGLIETGQNAIHTLLQSPIVRTGSNSHTLLSTSSIHKPPTMRDIPPVTLTPIPQVDPAVFSSYITQVGALYGALQRAKNCEEEDMLSSRKSSKSDNSIDPQEHGRRLSSRSSMSKKASVSSLSSVETTRRKSSGGRRATYIPTPLSTIPSVYFDESFHLENPRTFDVVSERSELVRPMSTANEERKDPYSNSAIPRKALATNAILQEKLSWYMDTIEIHLVNSISSASKSFFAALGSLRELHLEASVSVNRIKSLRGELQALDDDMAVGGLNIIQLKQRKENMNRLSDAVLQLRDIVEIVANCEALVESGDIDEALDTIDTLKKLISGEETCSITKRQVRDLRGAKALLSVTNDVEILRVRIGKAFEVRFLNTLMNDLRRHVESVSAPDTLQRWSLASQRSRSHNRGPSSPAYLSITSQFRSELTANLNGLHRAQYTSSATTAYRESVLREVRNIVRRRLPASSDDDAESMMSASTTPENRAKTQQEKSSILARNLRSLEPEDSEELLRKIYIGIGETLRRLGTQVKILLDITSSFDEHASPINSPHSSIAGNIDEILKQASSSGSPSSEDRERMDLTLDMSNLLGQSVDIAQDKIVKLLRVRSEQTTHLSVENFLRYFTLNLLFANECEAISGRSGISLKNVVNGHISDFSRQLSETQRQNLATEMEADSWNAREFTEADSMALSRIILSSTEDVPAWNASCNIWLNPSTLEPESVAKKSDSVSEPTNTLSGVTSFKAGIRCAVIESESFVLTHSATLCLHGISSFIHLSTGIPSIMSEIAASIISYLTLFNSRCTQLILGAGATRSAGLKNITTKHLALASQALSFICVIISHVREFFRRRNPSNLTTIGEFEKVRKAYLEHQKSIYDKLINIMASRSAAHIKSMRSVDWSKEKDGINPYMEVLTRETSTLHRVLSKHLPEETVCTVMRPVLSNYREQWGKAFEEVDLESESEKERMLRDVEWLKTKIDTLESSGETGEFLVRLVRDKILPKSKIAALPNDKQTNQFEESATPHGNDSR